MIERVLGFLKELYREIEEDDVFNGSAALGYYLTLAIFPGMIFLMALVPYLPIPHVDQAIMDLLRQALPRSAAEMFSEVVQEVTREQRGGLLSFGFAGALWATSAGMYAIMQQLNHTYDVAEGRSFMRARLTAVALSILFGVLVIGGFSLIVLGGEIQDWLGARFGFSDALLDFFIVFRWVVIVLGLLMAFALIYYLAPNVKQRFVFISIGSVVGVLLLMGASLGFSWYAQSFGNYSATYGSIGAVIVLMLWLYIAGLSILIGSEINALIARRAQEAKEQGRRSDGAVGDEQLARGSMQASSSPRDGGSGAPSPDPRDAAQGWGARSPARPLPRGSTDPRFGTPPPTFARIALTVLALGTIELLDRRRRSRQAEEALRG